MPRISSEDSSHRRQEILSAARACFAEWGYEGATVRRLEQATGKSRGAIFYHFADKENLFLALAKEDAAHMAEVVAKEGLVEVMRDLLQDPAGHAWLATRLEITRLLRTDKEFRSRWQDQQAILDQAVHDRLSHNAAAGRMRDDVPVDVLQTFLETFLDGLIARMALGDDPATLTAVLDLIEDTVRKHGE